MKLEAINPTNHVQICPATVIQTFPSGHFSIQVDSISGTEMPPVKVCTPGDPYIFPTGIFIFKLIFTWHATTIIICNRVEQRKWHWNDATKWLDKWKRVIWLGRVFVDHNVDCRPRTMLCKDGVCSRHRIWIGPKAGSHRPRKWAQCMCRYHYQDFKSSPLGSLGLLQRVLQLKTSFKQLANRLSNYSDQSTIIICANSQDIFPVGWCGSNAYPLQPPRDFREVCKVTLAKYRITF